MEAECEQEEEEEVTKVTNESLRSAEPGAQAERRAADAAQLMTPMGRKRGEGPWRRRGEPPSSSSTKTAKNLGLGRGPRGCT